MKIFRGEKGNSAIVVTIALVLLAVVAVVTLTGADEESENIGNNGNTVNIIENNVNITIQGAQNKIENTVQNENSNDKKHEHDYSIFLTSTKSTCTVKGNEKIKCKYCDDVKTVEKELDPNNHPGETTLQYVNLSTTHHSKNTVCASCFAPIVQVKEVHSHKLEEKVSEATCTDKAKNKYICTVCKETVTLEEGNTLEHTWDEGVVTKKPTEQETGLKTYTCSKCQTTKTETIYKED